MNEAKVPFLPARSMRLHYCDIYPDGGGVAVSAGPQVQGMAVHDPFCAAVLRRMAVARVAAYGSDGGLSPEMWLERCARSACLEGVAMPASRLQRLLLRARLLASALREG